MIFRNSCVNNTYFDWIGVIVDWPNQFRVYPVYPQENLSLSRNSFIIFSCKSKNFNIIVNAQDCRISFNFSTAALSESQQPEHLSNQFLKLNAAYARFQFIFHALIQS